MRYTGGSLAREEPDTPWCAAQWVPVAGPTAAGHRLQPRRAAMQLSVCSCGAATGAVMAAQADAG
eukprot:192372-Prymnesium_polylepis.1